MTSHTQEEPKRVPYWAIGQQKVSEEDQREAKISVYNSMDFDRMCAVAPDAAAPPLCVTRRRARSEADRERKAAEDDVRGRASARALSRHCALC
jgi:hypothetical protein